MKLRKGVKEDKPTNVFKREEYEILALKKTTLELISHQN